MRCTDLRDFCDVVLSHVDTIMFIRFIQKNACLKTLSFAEFCALVFRQAWVYCPGFTL